MAEDAIEPTADFHYTKEEIGFLSKVKSTKFAISILAIIISTIVVCTGYVQASAFVDLMQFTIGAYVLGDSFQKSKWSK